MRHTTPESTYTHGWIWIRYEDLLPRIDTLAIYDPRIQTVNLMGVATLEQLEERLAQWYTAAEQTTGHWYQFSSRQAKSMYQNKCPPCALM